MGLHWVTTVHTLRCFPRSPAVVACGHLRRKLPETVCCGEKIMKEPLSCGVTL
uniref:Uncharacterized protein n=1 Tax=Anguilla anguilla TaxID=7936 RepID=A0A0E9QDP9_ANGAN